MTETRLFNSCQNPFNPTVVRLRLMGVFMEELDDGAFNPTVVRLRHRN